MNAFSYDQCSVNSNPIENDYHKDNSSENDDNDGISKCDAVIIIIIYILMIRKR